MDQVRVGLAGDTMLGRKVAEAIRRRGVEPLVAPEVVAAAREADLFLLNLECCISDRGERWPDPAKPFFFRAPPEAVELLSLLGVDAVTLANNHALDYGEEALADTLDLLAGAGIGAVGAGRDVDEARRPLVLEHAGFRLRVVGLTDHPPGFAAGPGRPGVAFADLRSGVPQWVEETVAGGDADATLVAPHWGPNMVSTPVPHVQAAASRLVEAGATVVAGHSAHVFHGASRRVLYDLGDFLDDYAVDARLRNDLGLLFLVELAPQGPVRLEAIPLALDFCHTRLADGDDLAWIHRRFVDACAELDTDVELVDGRLVVDWTT